MPVRDYSNQVTWVSPAWLHSRFCERAAASENFVLLEAGYENRHAYQEGHIPGATYLDTNLMEHPPLWKRASHDELARVLPQQGISCQKTVALYSRDMAAAA